MQFTQAKSCCKILFKESLRRIEFFALHFVYIFLIFATLNLESTEFMHSFFINVEVYIFLIADSSVKRAPRGVLSRVPA